MPLGAAGRALRPLHRRRARDDAQQPDDRAPPRPLPRPHARATQVVDATRAIAILQKEHGERGERRLARWKYTIRRLGVDCVKAELRGALRHRARGGGARAAPADAAPPRLARAARRRELVRALRRERPPQGRAAPGRARGGARASAPGVRLTPQQDLLLCDVARPRRARARSSTSSAWRAPSRSRSCARTRWRARRKPTCGLAMTDAEGILPA